MGLGAHVICLPYLQKLEFRDLVFHVNFSDSTTTDNQTGRPYCAGPAEDSRTVTRLILRICGFFFFFKSSSSSVVSLATCCLAASLAVPAALWLVLVSPSAVVEK